MAGRWVWLAMAGVTTASAACGGGGEQILLGRERLATGNDDPCEGASCVEPEADAGPPAPSAIVPPTAPCSGDASGRLPIALRVIPPSQHGCPAGSTCQLDLDALRPAADGSVWVLGTTFVLAVSQTGARNWLAHFAADGVLLGEWIGDGGSSPLLVLDDLGQPWLASGPRARFAVQRFDAQAQPAGTPIAVSHVRSLVAAPGRGVFALTGDDLSLFDYEGQLLQREASDPRTAPNALASGPAGSALLSAFPIPPSQSYGGSVTTEYGVTVAARDRNSRPLWTSQSKLISQFTDVPNGSTFHDFDVDGNLVLAVNPPPPGATIGGPLLLNPGMVDIESIAADGHSRWLLRAPSSFNLGIALGANGEIWLADFEGARAPGPDPIRPPPNGHIAVIAQDGSSCRRYAYEGIEMVNALEFSAGGELWFLDYNAFGRFAPPTP